MKNIKTHTLHTIVEELRMRGRAAAVISGEDSPSRPTDEAPVTASKEMVAPEGNIKEITTKLDGTLTPVTRPKL